jgi:hypothetical protein
VGVVKKGKYSECTLYTYKFENRTMKPVEIVPRSREGGCGRMIEGVNLIKTYYKHICKRHNEPPHTTNTC